VKLQVLVTLDVIRRDSDGFPAADPMPGSAECNALCVSVRDAVTDALAQAERVGFYHPMRNVVSIKREQVRVVNAVAAAPEVPGQGCLRERRDDEHRAQLNVSFEGCPTGAHTFWATSFAAGLRQMAVYGLMLEPCGVENGRWVPPWRIKDAELMSTQARPRARRRDEED
jgi:hypothetical protein